MNIPKKYSPTWRWSACLWAIAAVSALHTHGAATPLPASAALPSGSSSTRGFIVRTVQAPVDAALANNAIRALRQIQGTLTDASGAAVANEAGPGPNADGTFYADQIVFEKEGTAMDIYDAPGGTVVATFFPELFPGIPGVNGHTDNFALEAVGYLELAPGTYQFGVAANAERTDVNNDDGFQVLVSANPRDYFGLKVGEFVRNAPGFQNDYRNETTFSVEVATAGIYPFRILYWQTGMGTSLGFYTVNSATGERIPVNSPSDTRAVKSYRDTSVAVAKGPYVGEASPAPGSVGNSASAPIEVVLLDGATTVATKDVKLFLNNVAVTPQSITKTGNRIQLRYDPNVSRTEVNNLVRLDYVDSSGASYSKSWSFTIVAAGGSATTVTGQWDFDQGDLRATVGKALQYFDPAFDGPAGSTDDKTKFGTTTSLGVADIAGKPASIMRIPGTLDRRIGYVMDHGISPNGGGTRVNQYTLIMDVMVSSGGASSLLQISTTNNTANDDGDLFWQGNNFGQGGNGYNGRGTFTPGEWHRVVAAYDMAANPPVVAKFVDGIKQDDWTANQGLDNPRRALLPTAILFSDGDQDERHEMWVNAIQVRAGRMSDAEIVQLGGPSANGIPSTVAASSVTGQWDFDFGDLGASIGASLQYFDATFDGPNGSTDDKTKFGTTTELGLADIGGKAAKVMRVPGALDRRIGYIMDHRIAPNGGGTRVNQYTLIMDIMISSGGAASLLQISTTNNTANDDGDLFWQGNNIGQGSGDGYSGRGTFTPGEWHRVVAAYDMAANPPVVARFVDGIKQDDWTSNQGLDAPRRALQPTAILFSDGDQDERHELWVNSVQIRAGRLTDAEIVLLGGPSADGIPVVVPSSNVTGQWDFEFGDLGATIGSDLQYFDTAFDGASGSTDDKTKFGTTADLGVADIAGKSAKIMRIPGTLDRRIGYVMEHRIAPNGGGTRVNQYTLIMDIMMSPGGASSLIQISTTNNTANDDGDLFWQGNNFGQGTGGYNGTGQFTASEWHRVIAAYDMAANPPVVTKFVDGIKQDDWTANQGLDNPRRALQPTAVLFSDGDQDERHEMWVSSIQIRSGKLTDAQMVALGGPQATGIPIVIEGVVEPTIPTLAFTVSAGKLTLSWPASLTGFTLQTTSSLSSPNWTAVSGVANNSVTVPTTSGTQFYRLKQ